MATLIKTEGQLLDWTLLDDTVTNVPFATSGLQTKDTAIETDLVITVAHRDANDAASAFVTVNVWARLGTTAEDFRLLNTFSAGGGQATAEALDANSGVSQANKDRVKVAATTDWDTGLGETLFLLDAGTLINSTLVVVEGWSDADYYIAKDDLVNDYDSSDSLFDGVDQVPVRIPAGVQYFEVTFHNADGDATYAVRVDFAEVTSIG